MSGLRTDGGAAEQIALGVAETKQRILHAPGGIRIETAYSATFDPDDDFAYDGPLHTKTSLLWPKYAVRARGRVKRDGQDNERTAIYDFVENRTMALEGQYKNVHITPHRHMFSSGYSHYFKLLQWAEGYQSYRLGEVTAVERSVPECLTDPYADLGFQTVGDVPCIHLRGVDDEIWVRHDAETFVHRRILYFPGTTLRKTQVEVLAYTMTEGSEAMTIPSEIRLTEFMDPALNQAKGGERRREFVLKVVKAEVGNVRPEDFAIEIPTGALVEDLIQDKRYQHT